MGTVPESVCNLSSPFAQPAAARLLVDICIFIRMCVYLYAHKSWFGFEMQV